MKRLRTLLIAVLSLIALAAMIALFQQSRPVSSGELALPDGTTVRIVAVTYGTNHECGSLLARWVRRLPAVGQRWATAILGTRNLAWAGYRGYEPSTVVWVQRITNSIAPPNLKSRIVAWLGDQSGFVSGGGAVLSPFGAPYDGLEFKAVPKRDEMVSVYFCSWDARGRGGDTNGGSLRFKNPIFGNFPHWEPEVLPATRRDGDLEVTLTGFVTGQPVSAGLPNTKGGGRHLIFVTKTNTPRNYSLCLAQARSLANTNQQWHVDSVVVSDATGNRLEAKREAYSYDDTVTWFQFYPGLWTNEHSWTLDFEVKRSDGFEPHEILTFHNVPLGEVDSKTELGWMTNWAGGSITLKHILRKGQIGNDHFSNDDLSAIEFTQRFPTNIHLDFFKMTLDTGRTNAWLPIQRGRWMRSDTYRIDGFPNIPLGARTADISFSVQTSRWVSFTVKPEVGTLRLELPTQKGR